MNNTPEINSLIAWLDIAQEEKRIAKERKARRKAKLERMEAIAAEIARENLEGINL